MRRAAHGCCRAARVRCKAYKVGSRYADHRVVEQGPGHHSQDSSSGKALGTGHKAGSARHARRCVAAAGSAEGKGLAGQRSGGHSPACGLSRPCAEPGRHGCRRVARGGAARTGAVPFCQAATQEGCTLMAALDTSVVLRLIVGDDAKQAHAAERQVAAETCTVAPSVLMECEWLLRAALWAGRGTHRGQFSRPAGAAEHRRARPRAHAAGPARLRGGPRLCRRAARRATARWPALCHFRSPACAACPKGGCAGSCSAESLS